MKKFIDLTGQKISKLTVVERAENNNQGSAMWLCYCECGNSVVVRGADLNRGHRTSCGCTNRGNLKHGYRRTRIYSIWCDVKQRCLNPNDKKYKDYGGRGIKICAEWLNDFQAFYDWAMANGYADNLTIDRINNDGNYAPLNCRWTTHKIQQSNRRNNHLLTYNNETHTMTEWGRILGLGYDTIYNRLRRGWDIERIFTTDKIKS